VPVGGGLDGPAWALAVFDDDGAGPNPAALYVGGSFQHAGGGVATGIAKWDGHNWSPVGLGITGTVYALKAFDDGTGPGLYAGGDMYFAGTGGVSGLAVWRNGAWSDVGGGVMLSGFSGIVESL
jgi:hypothetical protein